LKYEPVSPPSSRRAISGGVIHPFMVRAHGEMAAMPGPTRLTDAEVYAMIDALGDVGGAIERARLDSLAKLYRDLGIEVSYRHGEDGGLATMDLRVDQQMCPRGICALTTTVRKRVSRA
jgi:hypothetical protein